MADVTADRLCDRILRALEMALDQQDVGISELLGRALEMSLTRSGGKGFVERRDFDDAASEALTSVQILLKSKK